MGFLNTIYTIMKSIEALDTKKNDNDKDKDKGNDKDNNTDNYVQELNITIPNGSQEDASKNTPQNIPEEFPDDISKEIPQDTIKSIPQDTLTTPHDDRETVQTTPTSINLMSRLFRFQDTSVSEAPDTFYENEAWAPETESVGLFRKNRMNAEKPVSSSDLE